MSIRKNKKIVFVDVDGTLLNDEKKIPESACKAIREIKEAGNLCLLCTGRNLKQTEMFDFLGLDGAVLLNGSVVYLNGEVVFEKAFPERLVSELFEYAEEVGAGLHVLTLNNIYSNDSWNKRKISFLKAGFDLSEEAFRKRARFDTPLKLFEGETVYKIDVRFPSPQHRQKYYENLDPSLNMFIDSGYYSRGGTWYAELNHCEASKGIAVENILRILQMDKSQAYGFGDSNNDVPMLEACGTKVVMTTGTPSVREMADLVAEAADDDGIYKAVKQLGLDR